jgi:hypothetical protein
MNPYQPQGQLPQFRRGDTLTARSLQSLSNAIGQSMSIDGRTVQTPPIIAVILDEELAAPSSALAPTSAQCTVCDWYSAEGDGEYKQTGFRETILNHSEEATHEADTFGFAIWINGAYRAFMDCGAMASRPTPPWDEEE